MKRRTFVLCLVVIGSAPVGSGQQGGFAHLSVRPEPYALVDSATAFQVWGPPDRLMLEVRFGNEDLRRALVLKPGFFEAIRWQLEAVRSDTSTQLGSEPIVLSIQGVEASTCGPAPAVAFNLLSDVLIQPDGWVTARVVLLPKSGVLEEGEYRLVLDARGARQRLVEMDGSPWSGQFGERGSIPVVFRAFKTPQDRARYYAAEAGAAMTREDYTAALEYYRRMAAATPGDPAAEGGVGLALLELGRFAEAAATLEQVWVRSRTRFAGSQLAVAYAALGRDDRAASLVRQLYPPEIAELRLEAVLRSAKTLRSRRR